MADLAICCEDCAPVMQVRGEMGEGDYFGVISDGSYTSSEPAGMPAIDHYLYVVLTENNKNDVRIACRKCALSTAWLSPDGPGMPGIGREFCAKQWAGMIADKHQRAAMLKRLEDEFGKAAVKKFFSKSL